MFESEKFSLIANNLFLDFVNTQKASSGRPLETLETFVDFIAWAVAVELIHIEEATSFFDKFKKDSSMNVFLHETVKFRDILRQMTESIAEKKVVPESALRTINDKLKKITGFTEVIKNGEGFEKRARFDMSEPANLLQPIAESAADFLCYANFDLLRKCESSACVLYFYDTTKNHKRRWCSMKVCGNQAKAAAFYQRKKFGVKS